MISLRVKSCAGLILLFGLSGCMSGSVGVQGGGTNSPSAETGKSTPSTPGQSQQPVVVGNGSGTISSLGDAQKIAKTLFFAIEKKSNPGNPIGVGFISADAEVQTPFSFYFSSSSVGTSSRQSSVSVPYWKPIVTADGSEKVAWVQTENGSTTLEILDPESLESTSLGNIVEARFWDLSYDGTKLAGVTSDGRSFIQTLDGVTNAVAYGAESLSSQAQVQWVNGTQQLAVTDPSIHLIDLFSSKNLQNSQASFQGDAFSASPSGKTFLIYSNGQLLRTDQSGSSARHPDPVALPISLSGFSNPQWNGEKSVAFVECSGSATQLTVLDLSKNKISSQTEVEEDLGGVCPAWVGSDLYFTAMNQKVRQIWKFADANSIPLLTSVNDEQAFSCSKGISP